jgi:hypothetical protein
MLDCGHEPSKHGPYDTGYGKDANGRTMCYSCCADSDRESMMTRGVWTGYLAGSEVTNWPGSFRLPCSTRKGRHNMAGAMVSVWAQGPDGFIWYGRNIGDNDIVTLRRTKGRV